MQRSLFRANEDGLPNPDYYFRNVQATVYDMQGNIRISQTFDGLEFTLRGFGALEQGLYILNVLTQKGMHGEEIIIVE